MFCEWKDCHFFAANFDDLYTHGQKVHIASLKPLFKYPCKWLGCHVFLDSKEEVIHHILKDHFGAEKKGREYGPAIDAHLKIRETRMAQVSECDELTLV